MWRYKVQSLKFSPKNGDKVVAIGRIKVYEPNGVYQLEVDILQPQGKGDLRLEYEKLKARLMAEGLFDPSLKKELPSNPRRIGVVTSPTGAVIRDIIKVSRRRNPGIKVILYPVKVQGEGSSQEIAHAIAAFNRVKDKNQQVDLLIVGRGGGSMEDLWAFNEETTVRAVANSSLPVISAVGHQTDNTLCDLAADKRAATPSEAAEMAVADINKILQDVLQKEKRLQDLWAKHLDNFELRLERCIKSWVLENPGRLYAIKEERLNRLLDSWSLKEPRRLYAVKEEKLNRLLQAKVLQEPQIILTGSEQRLDMAMEKMQELMEAKLLKGNYAMEVLAAKLTGLNPLQALSRGYSLSKVDDKVLTTVEQVSWGQEIVTQLADGTVYSVVQDVERKKNGN